METPFLKNQPLQPTVMRPSGKEPIPLGSGIITKLLGDGGMASVYEIWNNQLEVYRAVKLLHPNYNREALERFQTEIKITAKLHHPNIIEIHGVGEWNGLPYIEMEKADGQTLEELIHSRGAIPIEVSLAIGIMVSKALEYAHEHEYVLYNKKYNGIIHRDLKPGNIMVCNDGCVKLMDFGIARPTDTSFHTIDGSVIGTLQYLSPEQLEGSALDIRTDLYSLGICLYEMVCGYLAFPENNISKLLSDKSKNKYQPLSNYDLKIPNRFDEIIQQCMTHEKAKRIQNASILKTELLKLLNKSTDKNPEIIVANFLKIKLTHKVLPPISKKKKISTSKIIVFTVAFLLLFSAIIISSRQVNRYGKKSLTESIFDSTSIKKIKTSQADTTASKNLQTHLPELSKNPDTKKVIELNKTNKNGSTKKNSSASVNATVLIDKLKSEYDSDDLLNIIQKEITTKHTANAFILINSLSSKQLESPRVRVLRSRILAQSDTKAYITFSLTCKTIEAELLLNKAEILIKRGNFSDANDIIEKSLLAPRELISADVVSNKAYYLKALSASGSFDSNPNETTWKTALGAWYTVKKEMRAQPNHEYYLKADDEISRIGAKFRALKDNS